MAREMGSHIEILIISKYCIYIYIYHNNLENEIYIV